jgi:hypothetical protein
MDKKFVLLVAFILGCLVAAAANGAETAESTENGIRSNMEENLAACTEENMPRLLGLMSKEMPNKKLFVETVELEWSVEDAYWRLDDVEVLEHSDAPHASCEFPYATAMITQSRHSVPQRNNISRVFRSACEDGKCKTDSAMAKLMAVAHDAETVKFQALFKFEGGKWKLVANLTEPEPVEVEAVGTQGRRVF